MVVLHNSRMSQDLFRLMSQDLFRIPVLEGLCLATPIYSALDRRDAVPQLLRHPVAVQLREGPAAALHVGGAPVDGGPLAHGIEDLLASYCTLGHLHLVALARVHELQPLPDGDAVGHAHPHVLNQFIVLQRVQEALVPRDGPLCGLHSRPHGRRRAREGLGVAADVARLLHAVIAGILRLGCAIQLGALHPWCWRG